MRSVLLMVAVALALAGPADAQETWELLVWVPGGGETSMRVQGIELVKVYGDEAGEQGHTYTYLDPWTDEYYVLADLEGAVILGVYDRRRACENPGGGAIRVVGTGGRTRLTEGNEAYIGTGKWFSGLQCDPEIESGETIAWVLSRH